MKQDVIENLWACRQWLDKYPAPATTWLRDPTAQASGITILAKLENTITRARTGLSAWYDHPISTGPFEDLNNKIKVLKRKAYGYRDLEYFKLKFLDLHQTKYPLILAD